ncbi:acyl carrier protein [Magnetospira thiophila]
MATIDHIRELLREVLHLGERADHLTADTPLLGALPELDSMAVATLITGLEERFDLAFDDADLSAEMFTTVGTLSRFLESKLGR